VALGTPGLSLLALPWRGGGGLGALVPGAPSAACAQAVAVHGHDVVQVQSDAHQAVGVGPIERGHDERQRTH